MLAGKVVIEAMQAGKVAIEVMSADKNAIEVALYDMLRAAAIEANVNINMSARLQQDRLWPLLAAICIWLSPGCVVSRPASD